MSKRPIIICLWSTPRSVSTAFEKTFKERSDTNIIHEPFTECYYYSEWRQSSRYGLLDKFADYSGAAAEQRVRALEGPLVFTKDLAFQAFPYVSDEFLREVRNTFMTRHPYYVAASLAKLKPDFTEEELGFTRLRDLWERVVALGGRRPFLVEGTEFRNRPQQVLAAYCAHLDIPPQDAMLTWQDGKIQNWSPEDYEAHAKWHNTLEHSRTILAEASDLPDLDAIPLSSEQREYVQRAVGIYEQLVMKE
ncbi:MAG: hypothetical protein Tsb0020_19800 [Haliangiales bacterium]